MGEARVEVELVNSTDEELVNRGYLKLEEVRSLKVRVVADTGARPLVLPQDVVQTLGLREKGQVIVTYADERKEARPVAGPVTVRVGKRWATTDCVVGPPNSEPLLGQIPLEAMDLLVDCSQQKLVPRPESPYLPLMDIR